MKSVLSGMILCAMAGTAHATAYHVDFVLSDYVYNYDTGTETTGSDSLRVTGSIVTDGAIGALTYKNFQSFNFTLTDSDGAISFSSGDLTSPFSVVERPDTGGLLATITTDNAEIILEGMYLFTATKKELLIGYGDDWMFDVNPITAGSRSNGCYIYGSFTGDIDAGENCPGAPTTGGFARGYDLFLPNSKYIFGQVAPVPIPATLPLLVSGFIIISLLRRKSPRIRGRVDHALLPKSPLV